MSSFTSIITQSIYVQYVYTLHVHVYETTTEREAMHGIFAVFLACTLNGCGIIYPLTKGQVFIVDYLCADLPEDLVYALDKKLSKLDEVLEREVTR